MIRKVLVFIILVFTAGWFTGAYFLKSRLALLVNNLESDNIKIAYEDIKVSGFPKLWKITLVSPKIKIINHSNSREITIPEVSCVFAPNLRKATFILANNIKHEQNINDKKLEYFLRSSQVLDIAVKFTKPLYRVGKHDKLSTVLKSAIFDNDLLSVTTSEKVLFDIVDALVVVNKSINEDNEEIGLRVSAEYRGKEDVFNFATAKLDTDTTLTFDNSNKEAEHKGLKINHLNFIFDESKIDLNGLLKLSKAQVPQGKFAINLINYQHIIDTLIPSNFIMPKPILKRILGAVANQTHQNQALDDAKTAIIDSENAPSNSNNETKEPAEVNQNVQFDIEFSDEGIKIGNMNVLDLRAKSQDQ